jgi:hypothetical protein
MRLIKNTGNDRVIDELRQIVVPQSSLDWASPSFSLFAFAELRELLLRLDACRLVLPAANGGDLGLTGSDADRAYRNGLQIRWLARECGAWIKSNVELRGAPSLLPQSVIIAGKPESEFALREGLDTHARLQRDLAVLRAQAEKEKQLNRRVELNLEIKRLEAQLGKVGSQL